MGQAFLSRPVIPALQAEEGDPPTVPPAPPTPPTKRKSKFAGIGKLFKPWKWRKRKSSDTFRETSEVLERKISMRKPKEELIKRGVLIELPEEDTPVTPESPPLRNGHTSQGTSEQLEKDRSLKRSSRQNSLGPRPSSQLETPHEILQELSKQPLLPPKRPLSTSVSTGQDQNGGHKVEQNSTVTRLPSSAPNPAPRTLHPPPTPKQPPVPPPKPQNRNSTPLMMELCQALAGNTLTPVGSRPSPPLPVKRGPPPTTDVITNKERNSFIINPPPPAVANEAPAPSIPSPKLSSQAPSLPPPPPEPPLPVEVPRPGKEEKETPMALPAIPLHIRIQQALNSPQPLPAIDNSQRAHSLLFLPNEVTTAEKRTRVRSLPITIELLKVPDDDDDEEEVSIEEESSPEVSDSHAPRVYIGDVTVIPTYLPPSVQEEEEEEEEDGGMSDSDSEGPILYKEEEEEEDDDEEEQTSSLANKVKRKDTLAMKLGGKISSQEPSNELPHRSREEWTQIRQQIGSQLNRRLSQRPSAEELEQRNILQKNEADRLAEKREIKRRLTRKLSQRPTVAELLERKILRFNEYVEVTDAHDYDRRAEKPWTKLTPADKAAIRKELNDFKSTEMSVHEESKQYTRFHRP